MRSIHGSVHKLLRRMLWRNLMVLRYCLNEGWGLGTDCRWICIYCALDGRNVASLSIVYSEYILLRIAPTDTFFPFGKSH